METPTSDLELTIEKVRRHKPSKSPSMKRQKPPASFSVGSILYRYDAFTYDDGTRTVDAEKWIVRSIRAKRNSISRWGVRASGLSDQRKMVNITRQIQDLTWSATKGWKKSIRAHHRDQFPAGNEFPTGFYTTPLQALKYAIQSKECDIANCSRWKDEESCPDEAALWDEDIVNHKMELKLLRSALTRRKKSRGKSPSK